jgi:hypothetical protein
MAEHPRVKRVKREKMNLTIHPEIRAFAAEMAERNRMSISLLVEDLVEAEWKRVQNTANNPARSYPVPPAIPGYHHQPSQ